MFRPSTDDVRIEGLRPLIPPAILMEEIHPGEDAVGRIAEARQQISDIVHGKDDRLLVVVGPCSIHDPQAALDYAKRLKALRDQHADDLFIVMRTYFEKPRTTVGWKGLINDPNLDGSFDINHGLRVARGLLSELAELDLPAGTEFLDPISPQFVADLVSWGAIGARTTESQVHRELASGLSMPVGFKNGTRGTVKIAVEAVKAARNPHHFLSVTKQGITAIVATRGNLDCHVILRGGAGKPNYQPEDVAETVEMLEGAGLEGRLMVDCSHANSGKDHEKQAGVAIAIGQQVAQGSTGVFGVMLESFLVGGRQSGDPGTDLTYGQSITDACMSWDVTVPVIEGLADSVRQRRSAGG
ncbi:MAG: 3-deoxy-7-phosphoheptulonate synthase [Deltaproteobacteria bacterium]|nr:MAG: 3-deoxy-7-phosphoheptulonate synthase [Deltaproteobacteria bacterium]